MKITGGMALRNGIMFQTLDHTATGIINSKGVFDIKVKERLVAKSPLMSHVERFVNRVPIIRGLYVIFENKLFLLSFMLLSLSKYVTHKEKCRSPVFYKPFSVHWKSKSTIFSYAMLYSCSIYENSDAFG